MRCYIDRIEPKSFFNHDLFADKELDQKSDNLVKVIDFLETYIKDMARKN